MQARPSLSPPPRCPFVLCVQIAKWLAVNSSEERIYALQVLLAVVNADPAVVDRLVSSTGAVRSVLSALRRSIRGASWSLGMNVRQGGRTW